MDLDLSEGVSQKPKKFSKNILKTVGLPLFFLGIFLSLYLIWKILDLPPESELIEIARNYFDKYGLITVLLSAIIEGVLLVGWYYPGSLVIFLGVIFAGKNIPDVIQVVSVVTIGLYIAYIINFFIGKHGWYRLLLKFGLKEPLEKAQPRLAKHGPAGIFLSFWQPNLAALTATAAGILQFPLRKFLLFSLSATILWNIFWGTLVYFLGAASLSLLGVRFVLIAIVVWMLLRLYWKEKPSPASV